MRTLIHAALLGIALVSAPALQATQESRTSDSLERAFVANGRIRMDLSAGEYRISGSPDLRIRLDWKVRDSDQLWRVKTRVDVRGSDATVMTDGPSNHFSVNIQVPARSDLYVRLTAGELRLERVEGNKDVELHAGELDIDVNRAEDYHSVDASVWAGEIHADPFHISKEGLFRSFDWRGKGPYRLHAKLKAGEVRLFSQMAERP
ncbi:MAG TPA: hypothetical protein VGQ16_15375 [Vicinamibacterales bacterium]|jgi:hypothetical protein|nr:hypothetical protein [Vicinamibacterales bacterium]